MYACTSIASIVPYSLNSSANTFMTWIGSCTSYFWTKRLRSKLVIRYRIFTVSFRVRLRFDGFKRQVWWLTNWSYSLVVDLNVPKPSWRISSIFIPTNESLLSYCSSAFPSLFIILKRLLVCFRSVTSIRRLQLIFWFCVVLVHIRSYHFPLCRNISLLSMYILTLPILNVYLG